MLSQSITIDNYKLDNDRTRNKISRYTSIENGSIKI